MKVTLAGMIALEGTLTAADLIRDVPAPEDTSIEAHIEGGSVFLWVALPSVGRITGSRCALASRAETHTAHPRADNLREHVQ